MKFNVSLRNFQLRKDGAKNKGVQALFKACTPFILLDYSEILLGRYV